MYPRPRISNSLFRPFRPTCKRGVRFGPETNVRKTRSHANNRDVVTVFRDTGGTRYGRAYRAIHLDFYAARVRDGPSRERRFFACIIVVMTRVSLTRRRRANAKPSSSPALRREKGESRFGDVRARRDFPCTDGPSRSGNEQKQNQSCTGAVRYYCHVRARGTNFCVTSHFASRHFYIFRAPPPRDLYRGVTLYSGRVTRRCDTAAAAPPSARVRSRNRTDVTTQRRVVLSRGVAVHDVGNTRAAE